MGGVPCGIDFDLDNVVWRTIDKIGKIFFIESALADLFPAGVYDRESTTALIYTQHEAPDK